MRLRTAILLLVPVAPGAARATTWHVLPDHTGDAPSISAALAAATPGDTVEVACGTYREWQLVVRSGILLTSATGSADCVTIDADGRGRALWCSGTSATGGIRGFTLTGGRATFGGGIYLGSGSNVPVTDCVFVDNVADVGGGAYVHHSNTPFLRCRFEGNKSLEWGGGIACEDYAYPTFTDCVVAGNEASSWGGGLWFYLASDATIRRCRVTGNLAGYAGGAAHVYGSAPRFEQCTFTANHAPVGGAFALWQGTATVETSIVWGNCAGSGRTLWGDAGSGASFACSDVDDAPGGIDGAAAASVGDENPRADPMFCDPASCARAPTTAGDVGLRENSRCLTGPAGCGPIGDPHPATCEPIAVLARTWGGIKSMWRTEGAR